MPDQVNDKPIVRLMRAIADSSPDIEYVEVFKSDEDAQAWQSAMEAKTRPGFEENRAARRRAIARSHYQYLD